MIKPIVLYLVIALIAGCAVAPASQPAVTLSPAPVPSPVSPTDAPTSLPILPKVRPSEKWIEVDLAAQTLRLRQERQVVAEYLAATGVATATETTTAPGVYRVQQMIKGPIENVPGVFVSGILIYDLTAGAGIHSMPMDHDGNVLDSRLGRPLTAGCVRVGEAAAVFKFATLGMRVWIH